MSEKNFKEARDQAARMENMWREMAKARAVLDEAYEVSNKLAAMKAECLQTEGRLEQARASLKAHEEETRQRVAKARQLDADAAKDVVETKKRHVAERNALDQELKRYRHTHEEAKGKLDDQLRYIREQHETRMEELLAAEEEIKTRLKKLKEDWAGMQALLSGAT